MKPRLLLLAAALAGSGATMAQTTAPARPVPEPAERPVPVAPARPVAEPGEAPPAPTPPAPGNKPPAPGGAFLQPDPANDQLALADLLLAKQDYATALTRYEEFARANPNHPQMRKALYQSAECLRKLNRSDDAENTYALIVDRYKRGEFVDVAAYRAAALAYNRRDYRSALPYFNVCRSQTTDPKLKIDATYRAAFCLQSLGKPGDATPLYQEIMAAPDPNPFKEPARAAVARVAMDAGKKDEALALFKELAESAADPYVRGEALLNTGKILSAQGKREEAAAAFEKVFALEGADSFKPLAQMALIDDCYRAKDYQGVIKAFTKGVFQLSDEMRAQMFLMTGNSYQRLGKFEDATKTYGVLESFFQGKPQGLEAGYRRLQCLYQAKDKNLIGFIDRYVTTEREAGRSHSFIDRALLLKAESLFAEPNPVAAAEAYASIKVENLPEAMRPGMLYKMSWAQAEAGQRPKAIESLNRFLLRYPKDPMTPLAMVRRGELLQLSGDDMRALDDFQNVIDKFPDSPGAEFAYQQAALIHSNKNDNDGMIKLYEAMLQKFPNTKAAPEARYALGRGYYRSKNYAKAIENLRLAREADAKTYGRPAGSRIVLSCYALRDVPNLRKELDLFLKEGSAAELPAQVPAWLGVRLYEDGDAAGAAQYLAQASTPDDPKATEPVIWKYLGKARLDAGQYKEAVSALDHYLETTDQPSTRASALLDKARAQFGLRTYDEADLTAAEGQKAVRQGKTNAWLSILRGDIAMAQNKTEEAAQHYSVPSQTMVDPEITPTALWKLVQALQKAERREEAKKFKLELANKYPSFQAPANNPLKSVPEENVKPAEPAPPDLPPDPAPGNTPNTNPAPRPGPAPNPNPVPPPADADDEPIVPVPDTPGVPSPAENPPPET